MQSRLTERIVTNNTLAVIIAVLFGSVLALLLAAAVAFTSPAIVIAGIVGLAAGVVVMTNIEYGLYAVIGVAVLLPFASIPVNLGFNPTFLDLALLALYAMWFTRAMTRQDEGARFQFTFLGVPLFAFMVLAIFSFVVGMSFAGLTITTTRHFAEILLAIATFFLVVNVVNTQARLERVIRFIIIAGAISAVLGVMFYFLPRDFTIRTLSLLRYVKYPEGDAVLRFINDDPNGTMRAISTSVDPNVLGGLMILVAGLTAPQILVAKPLLPRGVILFSVAAMFLCLVLTFSRGAFLGLGFSLVIIAFVKYRRLLPILLVGALIFWFIPITQDYISHLLDAFAGADRATQMRLGEYQDAFTLISRYPLFGVGFLGSPDVDTYIGVSSVYLLMAEQMGIVGVAAFLLTMGIFFFHAAQSWFAGLNEEARLAPILLGVCAALIGAMTAGIVDHYFFNLDFPHSVTLFWIYVGLGVAAILLYQKDGTFTSSPTSV
ncbi:MAG TPA: O-antigen ligase family protein [Anaerolineae bacterium]|nr:O-antigen ligase family protein [Anaerolineae bacterium]